MTKLPTTDTTHASRDAGPADIRRWRQYLADERAEAGVYRDGAGRRTGEEREILLALAEAETRHEQHWVDLLGDKASSGRRGSLRTRFLGFLARHFGSVFVLALAQRAEARSPYARHVHATDAMAADERIHEEVVRVLATRARGMVADEADARAAEVLQNPQPAPVVAAPEHDRHDAVGTGLGAAISSFLFFGSGRHPARTSLPVRTGGHHRADRRRHHRRPGVTTGAIVALLSGGAPLKMALRQPAIGYGAAAVTYLLGMLFGTSAA